MMYNITISAWQTISQPRAVARRILAMNLPGSTAALALLVTAVLGAVLSSVTWFVIGSAEDNGSALAEVFNQPFVLAGVQIAVQGASAWLAWVVGRVFAGTGTLPQAMALMAWAEWVLMLVQLAQLVLLVIVPPLAEASSPLTVALFFWLISSFVAELHGFPTLWKVLVGIVLTAAAMGVVVVFILAALVGAGGLANV